MSQPLVSILTPVHNEAEYLAECIESILAQTYQNWEYTIVDNCSTDASMDIARRYAAKDRRIRLRQHDHFLSVIPSHNRALRHLSLASKYCKIVFGDDWIFPECLERMVALAEEHPSAGIVGAYSLEGHRVSWTGLPYSSKVVCGRDVCRRHFLESLYLFGSATTVLYRADLIRCRDPFYNEANIHADTEAFFQLLTTSDFGFVHQVLTFRRVRPNSLSVDSVNLNTGFPGMLQILLAHGPEYLTTVELDACLKRHLSAYYTFLGKSVLLGRGKAFWSYHKKKLTETGIGFSRSRLTRSVLAQLCDAVLNPKHTIEKLLQHQDAMSFAERKRRVDGFLSQENG